MLAGVITGAGARVGPSTSMATSASSASCLWLEFSDTYGLDGVGAVKSQLTSAAAHACSFYFRPLESSQVRGCAHVVVIQGCIRKGSVGMAMSGSSERCAARPTDFYRGVNGLRAGSRQLHQEKPFLHNVPYTCINQA